MFSSISKLWSGEATSQYSAADPSNDLPPAPGICDLEKGDADKRLRSLRHLIKLNHANFALVNEERSRLNRTPDVIAAAFALGCSQDDLDKLYERETQHGVVKWTDSPNEVTKLDWTDFLGQDRYQRAFLDFFEDEVVEMGYHWRELTRRYLYFGERPLIQYAMASDGKAIARLASGLSMSSREVTLEGLALLAISSNSTPPAVSASGVTAELVEFTSHDPVNILAKVSEASMSEGKNALSDKLVSQFSRSWSVDGIADAIRRAQLVAALLCGCSESADSGAGALLNAVHGLKFVLVGAPKGSAKAALTSWWQEALAVYIRLGCPALDSGISQAPKAGEKEWEILAQKITTRSSDSDGDGDLLSLYALYSAAQSWPEHDTFWQVAQKIAS